MEQIRLMLVDDHEVVRQGLITLFDGYPEIDIVAEASNGVEAIERALEVQPDVVLMDITMPVMDGFEATEILTRDCENCRVLALTVHEDREFLFKMINSGAWGFVSKRSLAEDVINAIRIVSRGGIFLSPSYTRTLVEVFRKQSRGEFVLDEGNENSTSDQLALARLSDREKQVVKLVADGLTSTEVGEQLGITFMD